MGLIQGFHMFQAVGFQIVAEAILVVVSCPLPVTKVSCKGKPQPHLTPKPEPQNPITPKGKPTKKKGTSTIRSIIRKLYELLEVPTKGLHAASRSTVIQKTLWQPPS